MSNDIDAFHAMYELHLQMEAKTVTRTEARKRFEEIRKLPLGRALRPAGFKHKLDDMLPPIRRVKRQVNA